MATFPGGVKSFPTLIDLVDSVLASHQNDRADEIMAIEDWLLNYAIGQDGWGLNYRLSPSVSSNNLTLAILGLNGSAPSASNPVKFRIGNTVYTLTSATSFTKNAATNWMDAGSTDLIGGNAVDFFVYAIAETGASEGIKFGYSRIPYARTMGDFINTSTDPRYIAGNWTNFNSTDVVQVIGRFRAQLSTASFNWSIPSSVVINRPIWNTDWLYFTPLLPGLSVQDTTQIWRYKINANEATVVGRMNANGTSDANNFSCPLPITCKTGLSQNMAWSGTALYVEGATNLLGLIRILNTVPTTMSFFKDTTATNNWATTGNKRLAQMTPMIYEI